MYDAFWARGSTYQGCTEPPPFAPVAVTVLFAMIRAHRG